MGGLTLLDEARAAGLAVHAEGDRLIIRGPRQAEPVARRLMESKAAVLAALAERGGTAPVIIPFEGARRAGLRQTPRTIRWACLNPFCRHKARWWLSAHCVVQCQGCSPPSSLRLIVAAGDESNSPEMDPLASIRQALTAPRIVEPGGSDPSPVSSDQQPREAR